MPDYRQTQGLETKSLSIIRHRSLISCSFVSFLVQQQELDSKLHDIDTKIGRRKIVVSKVTGRTPPANDAGLQTEPPVLVPKYDFRILRATVRCYSYYGTSVTVVVSLDRACCVIAIEIVWTLKTEMPLP